MRNREGHHQGWYQVGQPLFHNEYDYDLENEEENVFTPYDDYVNTANVSDDDDDDGDGDTDTNTNTNYHDGNEADEGDQWETSSIESRRSVDHPVLWNHQETIYTPEGIKQKITIMTIPHLKSVLTKWSLSKTGPKCTLVAKIFDHLMSFSINEDTTQYNQLINDLNEEYNRFKQNYRPFSTKPEAIGSELTSRLEKLDFDYSLPYPWILEKKLTIPIVTDLIQKERIINIEFDAPQKAGSRVLLVALKLHPGSGSELGPFDEWPPESYRHAYVRDFKCYFSGRLFSCFFEVNKVHSISSFISPGKNEWFIKSIHDRHAKNYFFQIVTAHRDMMEWMQRFQRFSIRSAKEILIGLRRDFGVDRHGISASTITISLTCPLSLMRLVTPVRSRFCRHPQCFDLSSWAKAKISAENAFHCPICDIVIYPDTLFIDGLIKEVLGATVANEVIINPEEGVWRSVEKSSSIPSKSSEGTAIFIDLTLTPDEPVDPSTIPIKPDPGKFDITSPSTISIPGDLIALDDVDVVYNQNRNFFIPPGGPVVNYQPEPSHQRSMGSNLFDAILID